MSDLIFDANIPTPAIALADVDGQTKNANFIPISTKEAILFRTNSLMRIFFRKEDLLNLLNQEHCAGLRFYPAFDKSGEPSLLAVGLNAKREDLVRNIIPSRKSEDKCFISEGEMPATNIPVKDGEQILKTISNMIKLAKKSGADKEKIFPLVNTSSSQQTFSKVMFTTNSLESLLKDKEVDGIYFYTNKIKFSDKEDVFKTLGAVARKNGEEGDMLLSALPCPPHCGGNGYVGGEAF